MNFLIIFRLLHSKYLVRASFGGINLPICSTGVAKLILNENVRTHLEMQDKELKPAIVDATTSQKAVTAKKGTSTAKSEEEEVNSAVDELRSFFIRDAGKC